MTTSNKASPNSWGQDEYKLVCELFRHTDKEPQEIVKAWSLLAPHHRALLSCLMDLLTEPEHFLQSADMISLVYPNSSDADKEWVQSRLSAIGRDCLYTQTRQAVTEICIRIGIAQ